MKILLIDDHPLFRKGFSLALSELPGEHEILEAESASAGFDILDREVELDYIFLDLKLPDLHGLDFLRQIRARHDVTPVVVLSATESGESIEQCLQAGACGYLSKASAGEDIAEAVETLERNGFFLAGNLRLSLEAYRQSVQENAPIELTLRQQEVLNLLADGISNQEIAETLGLSLSTVKGHVAALCERLQANNRTQCVIQARNKKLLQ